MRPAEPAPTRLDAEQYFALVDRGELRPDDRVELLEGVVVSMPPPAPSNANAIARITGLLVPLVGGPLLSLPGLSLAVDGMLPRR